MRIYFSGIGGVGIGPLAQIAHDAGYDVTGSDREASLTTHQLTAAGISVEVGEQDGEYLRQEHSSKAVDYFVYTAALDASHPELLAAKELGIMCLKRDGMIARIIKEKNLSMIACAGTHGKTTTSGLLVWVMKQLDISVSYSVGTTLTFGPSGAFEDGSRYFVYECDEYDRNFLHFTPRLSLITSVDYDHPDTYPTLESYQQAFAAFIDQSELTLMWNKDFDALAAPELSADVSIFDTAATQLDHIHLPGVHLRQNAFLVERAIMKLFPDTNYHQLISAIASFPGNDRRFEKLADNLYSDYGHHPKEIAATLQMAREVSDRVVLVYQPHQNLRQHMIRGEYTGQLFAEADVVYWLPTYLSRENPDLEVLTPYDLTAQLADTDIRITELGEGLWQNIKSELSHPNTLVLCMGAGSIDGWLRKKL